MEKQLNIISYLDYRTFLKEWYDERKASKGGYSFRAMNDLMGFTSPNYLKLIMDRDRHLGAPSIPQVTAALGFTPQESSYFALLVAFGKAKSEAEKSRLYDEIAEIRRKRTVDTIPDDKLIYFDDWYNPVIRELITGQPKALDYGDLARKVSPPIHHKQAKKSVDLLLKLGFIYIDDTGIFHQTDPVINTVDELHRSTLKSFHKQMIELGMKALIDQPSEKREIAGVTLRVSEQGFRRVKKRVQEFREEILNIVQEDSDPDRVAQFNMQLFPISNWETDDE